MAGIYIHIPFCKKACHYCNFHFSTTLTHKSVLLDCILQEITKQKDYLEGRTIDSIYLGGGTPSLLSVAELNLIFERLSKDFVVNPNAEVTLECNPDDLSAEYCANLKQYSPVNRLSIGIQSFHEDCLQFMNRAHNASEALSAIENAVNTNFRNLTIDFIYGSPTLSDEGWRQNLKRAFDFPISHLSCYNLTIEENTALAHHVRTGKQSNIDEEKSARQFEILLDATAENGFIHYEISNFAKPDCFAVHNSNYWKGVPYLGIGPSAHSFNGKSRQSNVANNQKYIKAIQGNTLSFEIEYLSSENVHNEYVMTSLRTIWGCDLHKINKAFQANFIRKTEKLLAAGLVEKQNDIFTLTRKGKLMADQVAMDLFE
jgi:oxygen-independent coproporphyrinogen III oxidase